MTSRSLMVAAVLAAGATGTAHAAAVLTTSYTTWSANAAGFVRTTTDPNYSNVAIPEVTTSTVELIGGIGSLSTAPDLVSIFQADADWGPWTSAAGGSYSGIVYDTVAGTVTIHIPANISAFSLELQPSTPTGGGDTFTVKLSDGSSLPITKDFGPIGATAFIGYYGGAETSMTITLSSGSDFAFGDFAAVPEPGTLALFASGISILGLMRRRAR